MELWQWEYRFWHMLYAIDQSQQTGPSSQSEQSRLRENSGLEQGCNNWSFKSSGGQSTQIKYLSKSTDTYNKILLQ